MDGKAQITSDNRSHPRLNSGATGMLVQGDARHELVLVEISLGGFKLRCRQPDRVVPLLMPMPRNLVLESGDGAAHPAAALWAKDGLVGGRFYAHLSEAQQTALMGGSFLLRLGDAWHLDGATVTLSL